MRLLKPLPCVVFDADDLFTGWRLACAVAPRLVIVGAIGADTTLLGKLVCELRRLPSAPAEYFLCAAGLCIPNTLVREGMDACFVQSDLTALVKASGKFLSRRESEQSVNTGIIGNSGLMTKAKEYVRKVACTDCPVLIMGETGTGKELVARGIHEDGPRRTKPFVPLNCASIPDALFESELFGHERGAFTGALGRKLGKFAEADGGTLFLDEIGELSPYGQAKLLRVLETKVVEPLGGLAGTPVDVRFVSATNRPLEDLLKTGAFRSDLYYRLAVTRVALPSLHQRVEDIPDLLAAFLRDVNRRTGRSIESFDDEVLEMLLRHDWPGNVRELKNLVDAIAVEKTSGTVTKGDLPDWFTASVRCTSPRVDERASLVAALERTHWNKSQAAGHLGWSRMKLYRKLVRHGLQSRAFGHEDLSLRGAVESAPEPHGREPAQFGA